MKLGDYLGLAGGSFIVGILIVFCVWIIYLTDFADCKTQLQWEWLNDPYGYCKSEMLNARMK